jgi:hypothetical protein
MMMMMIQPCVAAWGFNRLGNVTAACMKVLAGESKRIAREC